MALGKVGGRPTSVAVSSPSASITKLKSARFIDDPEIIADLVGDSRQNQMLLGPESQAIECVTNDLTICRTLKKGTICSSVVLTCSGALLSDGTAHTSGNFTRTLSSAVQMNRVDPVWSADGRPGDITLLFVMAKSAAGVDGTVTDSVYA